MQGECGRPGVLEDIKGDGAGDGGNVRVVDLGVNFISGDVKGYGSGMTMSCGGQAAGEGSVGGRGEIDGKHHFEVTTLIGTISWTFKGAPKMKGRIVDELDIDIRRTVIVAALESSNQSQSDRAHKKRN